MDNSDSSASGMEPVGCGFNEKGLAALRSASLDFFHEVEAIRNNPHFNGNQVAIVASLLGRLPPELKS